ncbi:MAG: hypothetical protein J6T74_01045 [Clostridia bacterium]|nr:hypothetical protein [Clostridia bacterium]
MDIAEARKKSWVYKLYNYHKKDFINFLRENNYIPKMIFYKEDNFVYSVFELCYIEDDNDYKITVLLQNTKQNTDTCIFNFKDFRIEKWGDGDSISGLYKNYILFMCSIFGKNYEDDFIKFNEQRIKGLGLDK